MIWQSTLKPALLHTTVLAVVSFDPASVKHYSWRSIIEMESGTVVEADLSVLNRYWNQIIVAGATWHRTARFSLKLIDNTISRPIHAIDQGHIVREQIPTNYWVTSPRYFSLSQYNLSHTMTQMADRYNPRALFDFGTISYPIMEGLVPLYMSYSGRLHFWWGPWFTRRYQSLYSLTHSLRNREITNNRWNECRLLSTSCQGPR